MDKSYVTFYVTIKGKKPWSDVHINEIPEGAPLKHRSPWGWWVKQIVDRNIGDISDLDEAEKEQDEESPKLNPFFSRAFLNYMVEDILPFAPLLDTSMIMACDYPLSHGTNNCIESWHAVTRSLL